MAKVFGSTGRCKVCRKDGRKLHCKINGRVACMRCYSRWRYKDPKRREAQRAAVRRYYWKNRHADSVHDRGPAGR